MRARTARWPAVLALALLAAGGARGEEVRYVGHARDRDSGAPLYDEEHVETWRDGRRLALEVIYRDPRGATFARKTVDFARGAHAPDYRLEDARTGRVEAVEALPGGGHRLRLRASAAAGERTRDLPADPARVVDAGLEELFRDRLGELAAGRVLEVPIAVAAYRTVVRFRLRTLRTGQWQGEPTLTVRMEPGNPFFRLLAPHIDITFRGPRHVFWRYEGTTELRDADGRYYDAIVEYPDRPR